MANITGWQKFTAIEEGSASVDWLVMSAAAVAIAATTVAIVNAGIVDLVWKKLDQVIADAVDEIGNDATDRHLN